MCLVTRISPTQICHATTSTGTTYRLACILTKLECETSTKSPDRFMISVGAPSISIYPNLFKPKFTV